jgi:hypothetical protein
MRAREARRRVIIPARMRIDGQWVDVSIRNISSRGLMLHSEHAVPRGTYVEIRRDVHTIVGRAVWRDGRNFGLYAQDRINIDAVIDGPRATGGARINGQPERRHRTRDAGETRAWSAKLQYGTLAACGVIAAVALAAEVFDTLAAPFVAAKLALGGGAF